MFERIDKIVRFGLVAVFFAIVGAIALVFSNYDLPPGDKANDVRLVIKRLKDMGGRVEEFRRDHNRLPTDEEINCDLKPCTGYGFWVWRVASESDGHFSLTYKSLGVPFTPVAPFATTWHSQDDKTDRDGWDQVWRWRLRYLSIVSVEVAIILLPWAWLASRLIWRRQARPVATA